VFYAYAIDPGDTEAASVTDFQGRKKRARQAALEAKEQEALAKEEGGSENTDLVSTLIAQIMQSEQSTPDIDELLSLINGGQNG
jgi:hypothetical protein